jgi:flagellar biosynthetic protein FliQ
MGGADITDIFREAVFLTLLLLLIIITPGLVVGLIVSIFQAATQINEQTLSFIPRLLVTMLVLLMTGPWLLKLLVDFTTKVFELMPHMVS